MPFPTCISPARTSGEAIAHGPTRHPDRYRSTSLQRRGQTSKRKKRDRQRNFPILSNRFIAVFGRDDRFTGDLLGSKLTKTTTFHSMK